MHHQTEFLYSWQGLNSDPHACLASIIPISYSPVLNLLDLLMVQIFIAIFITLPYFVILVIKPKVSPLLDNCSLFEQHSQLLQHLFIIHNFTYFITRRYSAYLVQHNSRMKTPDLAWLQCRSFLRKIHAKFSVIKLEFFSPIEKEFCMKPYLRAF